MSASDNCLQWIVASLLCVRQFLFDWQTMITGILALFGAYLTVRQISKQISQVSTIEKERRQREEAAAKAVLPLALSEICQYARDCLHLLARHIAERPIPSVTTETESPRIPTDVIEPLQVCARFADQGIVDQIAALLGKLQVQHSRLEGTLANRVGDTMREREGLDAVIDAADVHAKASALFAYARNEEELRRRAPADQLRNALFSAGLYRETHRSMYDAIAALE